MRRTLPTRGRRTVGAWCFLDHFGPTPPGGASVAIGPHPHIGLQTVTWLVEGSLLHRDTLGSEQPIRPGQLNLMTAGRGVAHAEESLDDGRPMHGAQLWIALPGATRDDPPAFEHHAALPRVELPGAVAAVLVGALADGLGPRSPARTDTPIVGTELTLTGPGDAELPLDPGFEHALVVLEGRIAVGAADLRPGALGYLAPGRDELTIGATEPARVLLLGGAPFPETVRMWWNFVARSRDELETARDDWAADSPRFGSVASPLARIPAPPFT